MSKILLLLLCTLTIALHAQEINVSGKVTDADNGSPLPGVNVIVKGTANGATTDANGMYRINAATPSSVLVFSFIGLATQEVEVNGHQTLDVSMKPDVLQLGEVVVTALG